MELKTDYVDSQFTQKKYRKTVIDSTTITLEDATEYSVQGDYYGAEDLNKQNKTCNDLNHSYAKIDELIRILRDVRHITVADNSKAAILAALQTDKTNCYNTGIANGRAAVQNDPTKYGFIPYSQYQPVQQENSNLNTRKTNAQGYLRSFPSFNPPSGEPSYSFSHDPITDNEAYAARGNLNQWISQIGIAFDTWYTAARQKLDNAMTQLDV